MYKAALVFALLSAATILPVWSLSSDVGSPKGQKMGGKGTQYRGAVLEMIPFWNPQISPLENEMENVRVMTAYAIQAKNAGADIMVFPEQALASGAPTDRQRFKSFGLNVPDPDVDFVLCQKDSRTYNDDPITEMSLAAKALDMYMVFNVPEKLECNIYRDPRCLDGFYLYNTNVVFDRKGAMIAKYRKQHLRAEPQFDIGNNTNNYDEVFTTDFGVTFGQHIGYDVLFYQPSVNNIDKHHIRDFVMPTTWIDTLPFHTAPQVQYSWSRGLGVNLLAAGIHETGVGAAGSGIYTGASDILHSVYIYNDTIGSRVLVNDITTTLTGKNLNSEVPKNIGQSTVDSVKREQHPPANTDTHLFLSEELEDIYQADFIFRSTTGIIYGTYKPDESTDPIEYYLELSLHGDGDYFLFFYSGAAGIGKCKQYSQVASLVYCPGLESSCGKTPFKKPTEATFSSLNLTLTFEVPHVFVSIIDQDFQLVGEDKWNYTKKQNGNKTTMYIIFSEPIDFIYSLTVIGRWYERDPECLI